MNPPRPAARNGTADLLKGVAVILMIQVHILEQFALEELQHSTVGIISLFLGGPPAAPVFLAVMGWFAVSSSKSVVAHLRRGALLIAGGILLNAGLNANLLLSIHSGKVDLDPLAFLFGADILPLAGISIILLALITRVLCQPPLLVLLAAAVAGAAPLLAGTGTESELRYLTPFLWGEQWWSYFPLFPWFSYVLLGAAAGFAARNASALETLPVAKRLTVAGLFFILVAGTHTFAVPQIVELSAYYHHGLPLMLWIVAFLVFWVMMTSIVEIRAGETAPARYFKWLGRHVTSAYVFQWLLIGNIATQIYRTQNLAESLVWFAAVSAMTSLLVWAFARMPRRLTGRAASS